MMANSRKEIAAPWPHSWLLNEVTYERYAGVSVVPAWVSVPERTDPEPRSR